MVSHAMAQGFFSGFGRLFGGLARDVAPRPEPTAEDLRAERECIREVIWTNPGAFSSDLDVQGMMTHYSGTI